MKKERILFSTVFQKKDNFIFIIIFHCSYMFCQVMDTVEPWYMAKDILPIPKVSSCFRQFQSQHMIEALQGMSLQSSFTGTLEPPVYGLIDFLIFFKPDYLSVIIFKCYHSLFDFGILGYYSFWGFSFRFSCQFSFFAGLFKGQMSLLDF